MAIPNEIRATRIQAAYYSARVFICILGLGAIAWGGFVLPLFWQQTPLNQVASEFLQGNSFNMPMLLDQARQFEASEPSSFCNPTKLHNAVLLRLAIPNEEFAAANGMTTASAYASFRDLARRSLACAPTDSFVWLTLFWLDAERNGVTLENANYLRLSYALSQNEAWIALWRVRLTVALFERLPDNLANDAVDDFIKLVNTGVLYKETAKIFASATPAVQSRIAGQLKAAKAVPRQIFARMLYDEGINVNIPDTVIPGLHSWER